MLELVLAISALLFVVQIVTQIYLFRHKLKQRNKRAYYIKLFGLPVLTRRIYLLQFLVAVVLMLWYFPLLFSTYSWLLVFYLCFLALVFLLGYFVGLPQERYSLFILLQVIIAIPGIWFNAQHFIDGISIWDVATGVLMGLMLLQGLVGGFFVMYFQSRLVSEQHQQTDAELLQKHLVHFDPLTVNEMMLIWGLTFTSIVMIARNINALSFVLITYMLAALWESYHYLFRRTYPDVA